MGRSRHALGDLGSHRSHPRLSLPSTRSCPRRRPCGSPWRCWPSSDGTAGRARRRTLVEAPQRVAQIDRLAFVVVFTVYAGAAVIWLLLGLVPAVAAASPDVRGPAARVGAGRRSDRRHGPAGCRGPPATPPAACRWPSTTPSARSTSRLATFLVVKVRGNRTANLLALGMVGTAVAFNLQSHAALDPDRGPPRRGHGPVARPRRARPGRPRVRVRAAPVPRRRHRPHEGSAPHGAGGLLRSRLVHRHRGPHQRPRPPLRRARAGGRAGGPVASLPRRAEPRAAAALPLAPGRDGALAGWRARGAHRHERAERERRAVHRDDPGLRARRPGRRHVLLLLRSAHRGHAGRSSS